jgi:hypothetical protein
MSCRFSFKEQVSFELLEHLVPVLRKDKDSDRAVNDNLTLHQDDTHFKDLILFC